MFEAYLENHERLINLNMFWKCWFWCNENYVGHFGSNYFDFQHKSLSGIFHLKTFIVRF